MQAAHEVEKPKVDQLWMNAVNNVGGVTYGTAVANTQTYSASALTGR